MFTPLICGSFHPQEQDDDEDGIEAWRYSPSSTRKSRKLCLCRSKDNKNPYADRGLDKFTALLADLDVKRQKIYTQKGSENISFVRFAYSNSNDCKPIVVKVRNKQMSRTTTNVDQESVDKNPIDSPINKKDRVESDQEGRKKIGSTCDIKVEDWRWPSYYLLVIVIFILLALAFFGRSFAILCTSIGWYLVPTVKGGNVKRVNKNKKDYMRRLSNVKVLSTGGISSPRSVLTGINGSSPR